MRSFYFAGLRIDQFHAPAATPDPYWLEALKRDPGRRAGQYGTGHQLHQGGALYRCREVSPHGDRARYRSLHDAQGLRAVLLPRPGAQGPGKTDDAFNQFSKSTGPARGAAPGYFEMAEIASLRGDISSTALNYVDDSLKANTEDMLRAWALKAAEAAARISAELHRGIEQGSPRRCRGHAQDRSAGCQGHGRTVAD